MRTNFLVVGALLCVSTGALTSAGFELKGTVRAGARPQPNAVVWLDAPTAAAASRPKAILDQRDLDFSPHVLAVQVGTSVALPNNDRVFHNVFSFRDGKRFDLGLYPVGTVRYVTFDHPGLSRIFCNIHPNMAAFVMAVDTPYFGVSDREGHVSIPAVLPGTYTYHAWRPGGPDLTGRATIDTSGSLDVAWP